jgi:hypothetical protein
VIDHQRPVLPIAFEKSEISVQQEEMMFRLPPKTKNRVCAATFVFEEDLPKGQKLFDCSNCRGVCYISRSAQKKHWPTHKTVCCKPEEDDRAKQFLREVEIRQRSEEEFFDEIAMCLSNVDLLKGRKLVYCLQYLKWQFNVVMGEALLEESLTDRYRQVVCESILDSMVRGFRERGASYLERIWAVPDFANWLLSEDILLSEEMRTRKDRGEYPDRSLSRLDPRRIVSFPWLFLVQGGFYPYSASEHLLYGAIGNTLGSTPLAGAIVRRQMKNWNSRYIKETCGPWADYWIVTRNSLKLAVKALASTRPNQELMKGTLEHEVVPGIKAFDLVNCLLEDEQAFKHEDSQETIGLLNRLILQLNASMSDTGPFSQLKCRDRLLFYDTYIHEVPEETKEVLGTYLITLIMSNSVKVIFETYYYLKTPEAKEELWPDEAYEYLDGCRQTVLKLVMPSVDAFVKCSRIQQNGKLESIPQDCVELIAEFASVATLYHQGFH